MKKLLMLILIIGSALTGSYLLYGSEYEKPQESNIVLNNRSSMEFQNIGMFNGNWATILSDVRETKIDSTKDYYFNLKDLESKNIWCIKAIDLKGNEYSSYIDIKPGDTLIIEDVKKGNLITNKDSGDKHGIKDFDLANAVSKWEYRIDKDKIISRFVCKYKHRTKVMGKDLTIKSSKLTSPNKKSEAYVEKGQKNLSWVEIVYN
ncbi:hypothetical protein [Lagierella sp.]|uniref:hypothetical protein n=1 Tax=Lagierella sp. TaxID=2849657 RepID=UPI00260B6074|nr:hypothetical protein [Lagierella sp.]